MKETNEVIPGRIWVIRDEDREGINNIDTDQIFHNKHLAITETERMGEFIFGNLDGWRDFPQKVKPGDILIVGKNFGSGSSRQQAVDGFIALGIRAIVGESFGAIYWRNAVNAGLPVFRAPGIMDLAIESGDDVKLDIQTGDAVDITRGIDFKTEPMDRVQREIYEAGGLFEYGKSAKFD